MLEYQPHFLPSSVVLIGAGGTGSRAMPPLAQLVKDCIKEHNPLAWMVKLPIYVFDGDVVEPKNLVRQNFMPDDIGKNKAAVVSRRYGMAYKIPIFGVAHHFSRDAVRPDNCALLTTGERVPMQSILERPLIIIAVDSADARREILETLSTFWHGSPGRINGEMFVIDAGNEDDFGQVKFWTAAVPYIPKSEAERLSNSFPDMLPVSRMINYIPFDEKYYASLGGSAAEKSCADLPQTLAINFQMAAMIIEVAQQFLQMRKMNYDGMRFSMKGGMALEYNTPARWLDRVMVSPGSKLTFTLYLSQQPVDEIRTLHRDVTSLYAKSGMILKPDGSLVPKDAPKVVPVTVAAPSGDVPVLEAIERVDRPLTVEEMDAVEVSIAPSTAPPRRTPARRRPPATPVR